MVKVSIKRAKNGRAPVVRAIFSLAVCQIAAMPIAAMPAVAAESGCSGFACLFSRQETNKPVEPAAANDVARGAASPAPIAQVPNSPASKDAQAAVQPQDGERAKRQTAPPRPVITIAADPLEVARLKALALVVPRERIRIVRPDEPADLVLTKVLGDAGHSGPRLFTEAVHVVAGPRIGQMKDLEGKAVAFTGTRDANVIARQAFEAAHIAVWATSLDLANALDGLSSGDLDAVVVIAPSPVAQLAGLGASGLHLLSWPDGAAVPAGGATAPVEADRYPNLVKPGEPVRAMTIDAVLDLNPKGTRTATARAFLATLAQHAAVLAKQGFDPRGANPGRHGDSRVARAADR